jgi:hypothetical protein
VRRGAIVEFAIEAVRSKRWHPSGAIEAVKQNAGTVTSFWRDGSGEMGLPAILLLVASPVHTRAHSPVAGIS